MCQKQWEADKAVVNITPASFAGFPCCLEQFQESESNRGRTDSLGCGLRWILQDDVLLKGCHEGNLSGCLFLLRTFEGRGTSAEAQEPGGGLRQELQENTSPRSSAVLQ